MTAFAIGHALGVAEMDRTHDEFLALLARLRAADEANFGPALSDLLDHTRAHFDNESRLMATCAFPATAEHEAEHRRVLGELGALRSALAGGRVAFAHAYVDQGLEDWFRLHLATMDSALAACLKSAGRRDRSTPPAP